MEEQWNSGEATCAITGDARKSSVTMLKIWPTPLHIRTSPINRTRNYYSHSGTTNIFSVFVLH